MKKNILNVLLLLIAGAFLVACGSPEGKLASLYEEAAGIAESNKEDCGAMAEELTEFAKDNKDTFEEINKELSEKRKEEAKACEKPKSDECEDAQKASWDKADISAKEHVARQKYSYYVGWCEKDEKVQKAAGEFDKARRAGRK